MTISSTLLYAGAIIIVGWGIAHIIPVRSVVKGFGAVSADNRRIITMEWVAEGLAMCFIGLLVLIVTISGGYQDRVAVMVYRSSAAMLVVMAALTALTGARTAILPIKICPYVKTTAALLLVLGSVL